MPPGPPATVTTPDGWTLTVSSKDETALPVAPLTTAVSSRDYIVGGIFIGSLRGPGEARGILEVGYDIGCGIDMTTSNGVSLTGTTGLTPQLGVSGPLGGLPTTVVPVAATPVGGAITVGLKPGIINIVPLDKKEFTGNDPWVMVANFHVKIDGCVGIVHPLLCDADSADRSIRRGAVLRRRHQGRLIGAVRTAGDVL